MLRQLLLLVHLLAAFAWVGGMFFAHFCLRPSAAEVLDPPNRLKLLNATFARFLRYTALAVTLLLVTGGWLLAQVGFAHAPIGWHVMLALGLVMTAVFARVYLVLFPRLREACAAGTWPVAAEALQGMRRLVAWNLALGLCTVAAAVFAR